MMLEKLKRLWRAEVATISIPKVEAPGIAPRDLTIYLPPGFQRKREHHLLIALDGQTMPRWLLGEILTKLSAGGEIDPTIVVAVPASPSRLDEYGTAGELDYRRRGAKAAVFQRYLVDVVLPQVREHVAVARDPQRTGIFGASMGGLCAFDTAWGRPDVFGLAGVFSGALWWRGDNSSAAAQQASRIIHRRVRKCSVKPALRLWFQAGTKDELEDRDENGVIDAIQDTTELMDELRARGFRPGTDLQYLEIVDGQHHETTWAEALPDFLRWAWPRR